MDEDAFATFCENLGADGTTTAICTVYDTVEGVKTGLNTFFLVAMGALVFLMQTGFAMLCAGSVRQKNVKNIMLKNLLDACGGALGFYAIGYGLAYGGDETGITFVGNRNFGLRNFTDYAFFFFQFAFAATAATIVAGTVAERCKMSAYLCYSVFLTAFVYPVVVHSIWSANGFLSAFVDIEDRFRGVGAIDFAGSGVVHLVGGTTALIAAIILGPRKGRFYDEDGNPLEEPVTFPPHSVALQILGTFVLWFGWYGFNPGSALIIDNASSAAAASLAAVTTTVAAAAGCVTAMFVDSIVDSMYTGEITYDLTMAMNGCLGGLVAVTAGCSVMEPWAAIIVGAVAGILYMVASKTLIKLRIDDAVDAVPVHFANGIWGVLAVGLFAHEPHMASSGYLVDGYPVHEGWFFSWGKGSGDANLLLAQIAEVAFILGWVGVLMTPYFIILKKLEMFRVDALEEEVGLDISHHRGAAYDLSGAKQEHVEELMEVRASRHGKVEVPREVADAAKAVVNEPDA